jgi:hypothetical protein
MVTSSYSLHVMLRLLGDAWAGDSVSFIISSPLSAESLGAHAATPLSSTHDSF